MRNHRILTVEPSAGFWTLGSQAFLATPLPRFDGRSLTLPPEPGPPARSTDGGQVALRFREPETVTAFRVISRAALALALEKTRDAAVLFALQSPGDVWIRDTLRGLSPDVRLTCTSRLPRLAPGGAEQLAGIIRKEAVSVVVIDNLRRLLPGTHWAASSSRIDEAEREVLREIRRLVSGFDRPIEVVLFHLLRRAKARALLEVGLVDVIEELEP